MNYRQIKKLDEDTLQNLKEGSGPADECICNLLAPPEDEPRQGIRASIKKAFASIGGQRNRRGVTAPRGVRLPGASGQNMVQIPLTFSKGGKGIYTTKETVQRNSSCGKCGCDNEKVILKHSYANIRIVSPDISSICPCPTHDCMPDKEKLNNNIKVTIEQVTVEDVDAAPSELNLSEVEHQDSLSVLELGRQSASELMEEFWTAEESDGG